MNKIIEILIGIILLAAPIYVGGMNLWGFGSAALIFLKGGLIWLVLLIGIILVILGITDLKD